MQLLYVTRASLSVCVCSFERRSLSSQVPTQQQYNHKYLSSRGRTRETERETLCHCRVRDYKLNCTLLGDMSAQQLPASDIRGEESREKEGEAREAAPASSAINLSLFVCSKQNKNLASALPIKPASLTYSLHIISGKRLKTSSLSAYSLLIFNIFNRGGPIRFKVRADIDH